MNLAHLGDMRPSAVLYNLTQHLLYTKFRDPGEEPKLYLFGQLPKVLAYVKNHHLGLKVPYRYGSETSAYHLGSHGRCAFAEFTDMYMIEADFGAKVEARFDAMIEQSVEASGEPARPCWPGNMYSSGEISLHVGANMYRSSKNLYISFTAC